MAFFYFDKQQPRNSTSSAVFRALCTQLLHTMSKADPDVLDGFLLLREGAESGQPIASDNEILAALSLLLQRLDRCFLVIDGLDECVDSDLFVDQLERVCFGTDTMISVALFSRPIITLPSGLMRYTTPMSLDGSLNLKDIQLFLRPKVLRLAEDGLLLGGNDEVDEIVRTVASRANGMFLWAVLLMSYLLSPHLSYRQRYDAIRDLNRLEGLDTLYAEIIRSLRLSSQGPKLATVRAFEMVMRSYRPLHITELYYAVVTPWDRKLEREDMIPNFSNNLGVLTGALLEVDSSQCVRFIHLSAIEFLADPTKQSLYPSSPGMVSFDKPSCHMALACVCLSYLLYTIPAEPLSGSSQITPDASQQQRKYSLIDYATQFWSQHMINSLLEVKSSPLSDKADTLIRLASSFLQSQSSISMWIEASWMFQRSPHVDQTLLNALLQKRHYFSSHLNDEDRTVCVNAYSTLSRLS